MQGRWLYHNRLNKTGRKCRKIHMRSGKKMKIENRNLRVLDIQGRSGVSVDFV